jgi:geranylgeranyl reductase family protein
VEGCDVAVVGAGPAGAAAALAARRSGAGVILLDAAAFPRDKPCGDGISPHTLDVLEALGVPAPVAGFPPVSVLRLVSPRGAVVARPAARPAYTVPRRVFDDRLVTAAVAAGAELRRHRVRRIEQRDDRVVLDGVLEARVVIGADGAGSTVRRAMGFPANPDGHVALAIRGYAPAPSGENEQRIVTSGKHWPAYAWSFPIGDGTANVGYGEVLRGRPVTRAYLLDRLAALLPDVDPGSVGERRAHHLPLSTYRPVPGRRRVLLAGDALSLINPFTGEGIFYAVLSGSLAGMAAATLDASAAEVYATALRGRLGRHLRHSGAAARLAQRAWIVDGVVRAARADQRVFDAMLALGLGDGLLNPSTLLRIGRGVLAA